MLYSSQRVRPDSFSESLASERANRDEWTQSIIVSIIILIILNINN